MFTTILVALLSSTLSSSTAELVYKEGSVGSRGFSCSLKTPNPKWEKTSIRIYDCPEDPICEFLDHYDQSWFKEEDAAKHCLNIMKNTDCHYIQHTRTHLESVGFFSNIKQVICLGLTKRYSNPHGPYWRPLWNGSSFGLFGRFYGYQDQNGNMSLVTGAALDWALQYNLNTSSFNMEPITHGKRYILPLKWFKLEGPSKVSCVHGNTSFLLSRKGESCKVIAYTTQCQDLLACPQGWLRGTTSFQMTDSASEISECDVRPVGLFFEKATRIEVSEHISFIHRVIRSVLSVLTGWISQIILELKRKLKEIPIERIIIALTMTGMITYNTNDLRLGLITLALAAFVGFH